MGIKIDKRGETSVSTITVAVTQMSCSDNSEKNLEKAEAMVREAANRGAQIVLLQELFEHPYFCQDQKNLYLDLAHPADENLTLDRLSNLARELSLVLPISFFERAGKTYFNSVMVIDADGKRLGVYRKTHIPHDPGYWEKFYFTPGDTGFKIWNTRYCKIGIGVCWDQWFPEAARIMALRGADIIMYPTAIGSEPLDDLDTRDHWQMVMRGHAAANIIPVCASNRVGVERGESTEITFYGSSFIAGPYGEIVAEANRTEEAVLIATFDLDKIRKIRDSFHLFRDRRPEHYRDILSIDGENPSDYR